MQKIKTREELKIFLSNSVLRISKAIGGIRQSGVNYEVELDDYNEVQESIANVFNSIKNIIEENKNLVEYLLSGDFKCNLILQTPLFVILDYLYCLSKNLPVILSEEEQKNYESLIDYARELKFEAKVNKNWHVNEEIVKCLYTNDVSCKVHCLENKVYFEKRTKDGKRTTDNYNSTISAYQFLYSSSYGSLPSNQLEEYHFNYDYEKYPELVTDDLWLSVITNRKYEWGTWRLSAHGWRILLFKEQEEELDSKYQKLCEYKKILEFENKKKLILDTITHYLVDKSLQEFVVDSSIPWDEELFKKVNIYLEQIYIEFVDYLEFYKVKSLKKLLKMKSLLKK